MGERRDENAKSIGTVTHTHTHTQINLQNW